MKDDLDELRKIEEDLIDTNDDLHKVNIEL